MQYEFLKNFPKRMKNVGLYGVLIQNSIQKTSWKQFGFLKFDEQMNLIFAVMLYIMEQSLREENCTMDDIGAYIDTINTRYLGKEISYDDCRKLGDEYYGAAEPPVRCGESHLSGLTEPPHFVY